MDSCASKDGTDDIPEAYDFRTAYPNCVKEARTTKLDCLASSYALAALTASEDRVCSKVDTQIKFSYEEIFDCDVTSKGCKGGEVTKVLGYGKRKGFVEEGCYPEPTGTCPEDHFLVNECRANKNIYRIVDHCLATGVDDVKREILKNGPVLSMITPYTDFLVYSDGVY